MCKLYQIERNVYRKIGTGIELPEFCIIEIATNTKPENCPLKRDCEEERKDDILFLRKEGPYSKNFSW